MPCFVVLGNWTDQGIRNVQAAPERIKITHNMVEKLKGKMKLFYKLGTYDFVMIIEVPSDAAVIEILSKLGHQGNVRTAAMKAWPETEVAKILTK